MINKGQFVVLPAKVAKKLRGVRVSPMGVVPQVGRRDRMVADHSWSGVNAETQPVVPVESMQFGHALERIIREILLADPALGPVKMIKVDLSDGFYRLHLVPCDAPKLGLAFPKIPGLPDLVAVPLVLTMGWKNSPPAFSTVTETIADLCNEKLRAGVEPPPIPWTMKQRRSSLWGLTKISLCHRPLLPPQCQLLTQTTSRPLLQTAPRWRPAPQRPRRRRSTGRTRCLGGR